MTSTGRDKVPKNTRDIFVNSTTDGCSNHYANASIVSPQSGIVTQFSPDNNSNYSLDAKHSLLNHNHYNDQDNRHIQNRESGSNQSGSDSGLGYTNSISSENSLIVSAGTRTDQISNINTIDCNIYNDGGQSKNPHHHTHNNRKSIDKTAVIDNTGDNKTAHKVVSDDANSPVSKNYVDHNNNNEISGKDANKNLDTLSAITSSKNSICEKNQRHPNNASPSSLPLPCTKVSSDVKVLADVCETKASVTIGKPRNVVPTKPKHSDGTTHSAANASAPSNQTTSHDAELDRINRKYHVGYDSHTDASNHSDTDALAVSSQTTSTNNNVPMLKSALKKAFTNTVDAPIKTKRSCRNVSFNQTVIVFCEEIEASSPNEQFDPPIDYRDLPNYGNDPYEISENYDEDDYVKGDQDRQSGAIVREDLDILSKIVGEDASKLSDDQIFGLLENGSLFNNIDLNSGHLSDDDEFTKTRLNSNQSYLCHDAISDTESESSLVIEDCKRESDAILKSNQRVVSSSQVIKEKNHRNTDEDKVVQSNSIDCKLSSCDQNDLSVNLQVSQKNDRTSASQCKVSASLHTRSMPARMKVSPVDNQARRQQHQNVQSNHKNTNQDSDEHKTETNLIYSTSDNINQPKVLHYPSKTENVIKSNPIKVKQSNIEPIILSRPILRGNVFDSIPQKKQLVQDQDFRPIMDSTLIPNSSAIARTNIQTVVSSSIDVQQRPKEINTPSYRLQQPNIVVKNSIQTMQGNPACHICRAIESDLNPVNNSMTLGQFNHSIQNDVLLGTAATELIQQNNMQRSLQQINQSHETGATNLEELKKQPQPLPSNQSCVSCRELSLRKQQQQQQHQPQQQQNYPPQNYFGQASANFGQQPRQIACQLVYVIDQNGNRVKALQVVNPTQHIALNTITGQPTRKIFIAPDVNRLPNPSSVSRQHFAHPPDVKNENSNSYAAQNIPAKNAQNFMTGNAQINQQNSLVNRVVAINNQTSFNDQRMQIMNHTASRNHTIYYVRQPLGAQNIRHSLELSPSSTPKSFPDVHEIRRLDGIRAPTASTNFAHRQQVGHASAVQQPQPPQHAGTSMQYQSNGNERISAPKADDADDPSFGFSRRPAVKVVATVASQNVKPSESIPKSIQTGSSNYSLNCVLTNGIVYKKGENDQPQCLVAGSQTLDRKSMNRSQQSHQAAKENIPNTSSMSNINRTISAFPSTVGVTGPRPSYKSKDLSAASEEERRLIKEILSDTSVVNFAEPLGQQSQILNQQPQDQNNQQHLVTAYPNKINSSAKHNTYQNNTVYTNSSSGAINNSVRKGHHNNSTNNIENTKGQAYVTTNSQETSPGTLKTTINDVVAKNTPPIIQTSPQNTTYTTNNSTQSTSTVPPQTVANQMPPQMAGDMNSVIGMDMASSQPQGYAIPAPPPTHVTAFGPGAPPPPHHVYGGPPIFQPTYTHYIFPYNLPYPMSYVLPPTNSVVPTRQQVASQSNQLPNSTLTNNFQSRSHSHHPRPSKPKDMQKQIQLQHHHQHQHHHQQHHHQQLQHQPLQHPHPHQHQQTGFRQNVNLESGMSRVNDVSEQHRNPYLNYAEKSYQQQETPTAEEISEIAKPEESICQPEQQQKLQHKDVQEVDDSKKSSSEEETIKVSSDEGFDTQSSLDISKQSHESSSAFVSDRSKSPREDCNNLEKEKATVQSLKTNDEEKSQQLQDSKPGGPWRSASTKSWASLFKPDGSVYRSSINGNTEHNDINTDPDNSEDDINVNQKVLTNSENDFRVSNSHVSTKEQRSHDAARRALDELAPRLAQKISSISLKHSLPLLRPRGFINKGNGCYINSTLQALIACPPFYNLMKEIGDLRILKRDNSSTPILDSFVELFQNFPPLDASKKNKQSALPEQKLQMNYLQAEAIEPKCIYNVLGDIKSECLRGAQEDAEEFLSSVLNGLHEEMIGLSETLQSTQNNTCNQNGHLSDTDDINGDSNNDENLWREVGPKNRSLPIRAATVINTPIQEIFGGSLFSIRTAGRDRCGHRSPFFDLQLDISGDNVKSLQDAIKSFTATEIIQDFYCSKTKQKLDAQRRTSLDQLPPILILHLKQFIYTQDHGLKKLMKRIEYPIDFELPEGCLHDKNSDKSLKNSRSYKLLAVVYHDGKEAVKGHYLTDVYHIGSSQWIRCDDSNLKVVPAPRIENPESSRTPYLLFYRRLNTLGPRQSNSHDNKKKS